MIPDDLKAMLDGQLRPIEAEVVASRLREDEAAQAMAADFQAISRVLKQEAIAPPAQGMEATLFRLQATRPKSNWRWVPAFGGGFALAAALALFVVVPLLRSGAGGSETVAMRAILPNAGSTFAAPMAADSALSKAPEGETVPQPAAERKAVANAPAGAAEKAPEKLGPKYDPVVPTLPGVLPMAGTATPGIGGKGAEATVRELVATMKGRIVKSTVSPDATGRSKTLLISVATEKAETLFNRLRSALASLADVGEPYDDPSERPKVAARADVGMRSLDDMESEMAALRARKADLLAQFFEDAKPVQEVQNQITDLQKKIDAKKAVDRAMVAKRRLIEVVIGDW